MSDFSVTIEEIRNVVPIEGADNIEAAKVGEYYCVVLKDQFKRGDLVAYIPEQSIVPLDLLTEMGLEGRLSGNAKNRVKAIKLRGTLSQGLVYSLRGVTDRAALIPEYDVSSIIEGSDVTDVLGIKKYEPTLPHQFNGDVVRGPHEMLNYDVNDYKKYSRLIADGDMVEFTEKIHGTLMQVHYNPITGTCLVSSKGMGSRGFVLPDSEKNRECNVYIKAYHKFNLGERLKMLSRVLSHDGFNLEDGFFIVGEVFGVGIQDLHYGDSPLEYRMFDIYIGKPNHGFYVDCSLRDRYGAEAWIPTVPVLYNGPFSKEILDMYTSGLESVSGTEHNIREGVVIRPAFEQENIRLGRVCLKSVSEKYLLRKGEVTEFQ